MEDGDFGCTVKSVKKMAADWWLLKLKKYYNLHKHR